MGKYAKFGAMIAFSTIIMLGLMYINTFQLDHVFFSETRGYMGLLMGDTMAIIMLAFILDIYPIRRVNLFIVVASLVVFCGAL